MAEQWAVVLLDGSPHPCVHAAWGPVDEATARDLAAYLTAEVDPAEPVRLLSPVGELILAARENEAAGDGRPCCDHCNNLAGDPGGHDYGDESAHDGPCAECEEERGG